LNFLRQVEMEQVLPFLPAGARILEFGSGTGKQARLLADHGFDVVAVDLASSNYASDRIFPVQDYDGHHIPIEDKSVDVIFSSNVLEHVENLEEIFGEFRRILKPEGFALHVLPTTAWRFWSFATGIAASLRAAVLMPTELAHPPAGGRWNVLKRDLRRIASGFIPRAHGTSAEGLSELWTFSRMAWRRKFNRYGFEIVDDWPMGLFYTGTLFRGPALPIAKRQKLGAILGSAAHIYRLRVRPVTV
jgi:SAM-dependent methyltransferase